MDFTVDLTQEAVVPLTADQVDSDATVKPAAADQAATVDLVAPVQSPREEKTEDKCKILIFYSLQLTLHVCV